MRHATHRADRSCAGAPSPHEDNGAFIARVVRRLGRRATHHGPEAAPGSADTTGSAPAPAGVLSADDMARLWQELLAEALTPAQEAAVLMGLRIHGESADMLASCAEATRPWCAQLATRDRAVVVLHCIGTARRQPALAPLLALRLAQLGTPVLVVTHVASGRSSGACAATVLQALGVRAADNGTHAGELLATQRLAWLPVQALSPALGRLLGRRAELGFRNTAHAVIKLLSPVAGGVIVANYTHAAYRASFGAALRALRRTALLIRGTDGDPVGWSSPAHAASAWLDGKEFELPADAGAVNARAVDALPAASDVEGTASYIRARLATGDLPAPIEAQVRQLEALAVAEEITRRAVGAA